MRSKRPAYFLSFPVVLLVAFVLGSPGGGPPIWAETPTPSGPGLPHSLHVVNPNGGPVPDTWQVVLTNADARPPATPAEVRAAAEREPCAIVPISFDFADFVPDLSHPDCPEGTRIAVTILTATRTGFGAEAVPPIEWRRARPGEQLKIVRVEMVPPNTAGSTTPAIQPPNTGDAGLR